MHNLVNTPTSEFSCVEVLQRGHEFIALAPMVNDALLSLIAGRQMGTVSDRFYASLRKPSPLMAGLDLADVTFSDSAVFNFECEATRASMLELQVFAKQIQGLSLDISQIDGRVHVSWSVDQGAVHVSQYVRTKKEFNYAVDRFGLVLCAPEADEFTYI